MRFELCILYFIWQAYLWGGCIGARAWWMSQREQEKGDWFFSWETGGRSHKQSSWRTGTCKDSSDWSHQSTKDERLNKRRMLRLKLKLKWPERRSVQLFRHVFRVHKSWTGPEVTGRKDRKKQQIYKCGGGGSTESSNKGQSQVRRGRQRRLSFMQTKWNDVEVGPPRRNIQPSSRWGAGPGCDNDCRVSLHRWQGWFAKAFCHLHDRHAWQEWGYAHKYPRQCDNHQHAPVFNTSSSFQGFSRVHKANGRHLTLPFPEGKTDAVHHKTFIRWKGAFFQ